MATLNMRYGGNIVSIPEGTEFSPGNYGTARLKFRVNSTSVGKFGLTTNTNAKEYCKLQMRVGGQICYIGRVSTTSYISGGSVDYHGSSMGSRSVSSVSASEYATSNASRSIEYYSSSMSTSTSRYTQVTSTEQVQTNYYTQEVLSKTEYVTYGNGSGNGTSSYNPGIGDAGEIDPINYRTSSTETTRTLSEKILTNSSYRETYYESAIYNKYLYYTYNSARNGGSINQQVVQSFTTESTYNKGSCSRELWNQHANATKTSLLSNVHNTGTVSYNFKVFYKTGNSGSNVTVVSSTYTKMLAANWTETDKEVRISRGKTATITTTYNQASTYNTSEFHCYLSTTYTGGKNSTTYGSYSSKWTYYWISYVMSKASYYSTRTVREYSTRSYTGSTYYSSITRSTSSVSETIHNMNI